MVSSAKEFIYLYLKALPWFLPRVEQTADSIALGTHINAICEENIFKSNLQLAILQHVKVSRNVDLQTKCETCLVLCISNGIRAENVWTFHGLNFIATCTLLYKCGLLQRVSNTRYAFELFAGSSALPSTEWAHLDDGSHRSMGELGLQQSSLRVLLVFYHGQGRLVVPSQEPFPHLAQIRVLSALCKEESWVRKRREAENWRKINERRVEDWWGRETALWERERRGLVSK